MGPLRAANLALRLVLELGALLAFGLGASALVGGGAAGMLAGAGAAIAAAVAWGLIVSPKARVDRGPALRVAVEALVLVGAVGALVVADRPVAAVVYGVLLVVHEMLFHALDPTATSRARSA